MFRGFQNPTPCNCTAPYLEKEGVPEGGGLQRCKAARECGGEQQCLALGRQRGRNDAELRLKTRLKQAVRLVQDQEGRAAEALRQISIRCQQILHSSDIIESERVNYVFPTQPLAISACAVYHVHCTSNVSER